MAPVLSVLGDNGITGIRVANLAARSAWHDIAGTIPGSAVRYIMCGICAVYVRFMCGICAVYVRYMCGI